MLGLSLCALALAAQTSSTPSAPTTSTPSPPSPTCHLGVMNFENQGLPPGESFVPAVVVDAVAAVLAERSGCQVITQRDVASMLEVESQRQACGGTVSDSCLAEIGSALGVERMVTGSVTRLGDATTVSARLLDLRTGEVKARAEATTKDAAALRGVARRVGEDLLGASAGTSTSTTSTSTSTASGALFWTGAGLAALGAAGAGVGTAVALSADGVLADATAKRAAKDDARTRGTWALIGLGAGAVVGVAGGVLLALGGGE